MTPDETIRDHACWWRSTKASAKSWTPFQTGHLDKTVIIVMGDSYSTESMAQRRAAPRLRRIDPSASAGAISPRFAPARPLRLGAHRGLAPFWISAASRSRVSTGGPVSFPARRRACGLALIEYTTDIVFPTLKMGYDAVQTVQVRPLRELPGMDSSTTSRRRAELESGGPKSAVDLRHRMEGELDALLAMSATRK